MTQLKNRMDGTLLEEQEPEYEAGDPDDPFYGEENMKWIRQSIKHSREGRVIVKTFEELEAMANE